METRAPDVVTIAILSDIHYAGTAERACGNDYEFRTIANPLFRALVHAFRHFIWMRHPLDQAPQLDRCLAEIGPVDYLVANGDYICDTGFVGVGDRVRLTLGDHDLGKLTFFGVNGGMRLASWHCATEQLGLSALWKLSLGRYLLLGVASPLIALPANRADALPDEWPEWQRLRETHLAEIRAVFDALQPDQRVLLFCHDPTALPFLWHEESVRRRLPQVEQTIIGHLHTPLVLWKSRVLSGIPPLRFLGRSISRFTSALHEAHHWWPFRLRLCPALSGTELLNDGGYYTVQIDPAAKQPARFTFHPLPR